MYVCATLHTHLEARVLEDNLLCVKHPATRLFCHLLTALSQNLKPHTHTYTHTHTDTHPHTHTKGQQGLIRSPLKPFETLKWSAYLK